MRVMAHVIVAFAAMLATAYASAEPATADSFEARFSAGTQRQATFDPSSDMVYVRSVRTTYVHPLDKAITQRRHDLRAYLHEDKQVDDLPYSWMLPAKFWPVISVKFDDELPSDRDIPRPPSPPSAIAATDKK